MVEVGVGVGLNRPKLAPSPLVPGSAQHLRPAGRISHQGEAPIGTPSHLKGASRESQPKPPSSLSFFLSETPEAPETPPIDVFSSHPNWERGGGWEVEGRKSTQWGVQGALGVSP